MLAKLSPSGWSSVREYNPLCCRHYGRHYLTGRVCSLCDRTSPECHLDCDAQAYSSAIRRLLNLSIIIGNYRLFRILSISIHGPSDRRSALGPRSGWTSHCELCSSREGESRGRSADHCSDDWELGLWPFPLNGCSDENRSDDSNEIRLILDSFSECNWSNLFQSAQDDFVGQRGSV